MKYYFKYLTATDYCKIGMLNGWAHGDSLPASPRFLLKAVAKL